MSPSWLKGAFFIHSCRRSLEPCDRVVLAHQVAPVADERARLELYELLSSVWSTWTVLRGSALKLRAHPRFPSDAGRDGCSGACGPRSRPRPRSTNRCGAPCPDRLAGCRCSRASCRGRRGGRRTEPGRRAARRTRLTRQPQPAPGESRRSRRPSSCNARTPTTPGGQEGASPRTRRQRRARSRRVLCAGPHR